MLGAEVAPAGTTDELSEGLLEHILAVRRAHVGLRQATAVVVIESNLPLVAESVRRHAEQRPGAGRLCVMAEDLKRSRSGDALGAVRAGTRTTRQNKPELVAALANVLQLRAMRFVEPFVVARLRLQPSTEGAPRANILQELADFKVEIRRAKGKNAAYRPPDLIYSGQHPGSGRARDDYVMALGFVFLLYEVFVQSPMYAAYR